MYVNDIKFTSTHTEGVRVSAIFIYLFKAKVAIVFNSMQSVARACVTLFSKRNSKIDSRYF